MFPRAPAEDLAAPPTKGRSKRAASEAVADIELRRSTADAEVDRLAKEDDCPLPAQPNRWKLDRICLEIVTDAVGIEL